MGLSFGLAGSIFLALGTAKSNNPCANAPTAPPYAASSPIPSTSSCSGLYPLFAIAFCANPAAASVAASIPPVSNALPTLCTPLSITPASNFFNILAGAKSSNRPTGAPYAVAVAICSGVASASSARNLASPAPAPVANAVTAALPTIPKGANAKNGIKEPNASPNFLPTVSSYPGVGAANSLNGFNTSVAVSRIPCSVTRPSSSANAEAPTAAVSTNPAAPGIIPLKNSFVWPVMSLKSSSSSVAFRAVVN